MTGDESRFRLAPDGIALLHNKLLQLLGVTRIKRMFVDNGFNERRRLR